MKMFTDYTDYFSIDGDVVGSQPSGGLPSLAAADDFSQQQQHQIQPTKTEPGLVFANQGFDFGQGQQDWDPSQENLNFAELTRTTHLTVSPAELMSAASTASSCFSELEESPLIEDLDFAGEAAWTSLFEDQPPLAAPSHTATPTFVANTLAEAERRSAAVVTGQKRPLANPSPASTMRHSMAVPAAPESQRKGPLTFSEALALEVNKKLKRDHDRFAVGPTGNKIDEHGVTVYKRKPRTAPLKAIAVPEGDTVASKRARNTESARKSRARKMERMVQLEDLVQELTQDKQDLEAEVARLKKLCGEA